MHLFILRLLIVSFVLLPIVSFDACTEPAQPAESSRSRLAVSTHKEILTEALRAQTLEPGAPLYLRITKQTAELTAFVRRSDGVYEAFRSWPVCTFSGGLGPKHRVGDGKSPEGFYAVKAGAMNPQSSYHLSFNLGFPNAYDRAQGYTGSYLMVHGSCVSIGCYAMTNTGIEEIWTLMNMAFEGGQMSIPVHIYPFPMSTGWEDEWADHEAFDFWQELAPAWRSFETKRQPPNIHVTNGTYVLK